MANETEMTVLELENAGNLSLNDILYILQGSGTDRDRKVTLERIRNFLANAFLNLSISGNLNATGNIEATGDISTNAGSLEAAAVNIANDIISLICNNTDGLKVSDGSSRYFKISNGKVYIKDFVFETNGAIFADNSRMTNNALAKKFIADEKVETPSIEANKMILPLIEWTTDEDYPANPAQGQLCVVKTLGTQKYHICVYDTDNWRIIS